MFNPTSLLLSYQKEMLDLIRKNKFTFLLCSRQVGKSFCISFAAVETAWTKPGSKVIILSSGERSAVELLDKCKRIAKVFQTAFSDTAANLTIDINATEIRFSNGSRIITLPSGDPDKIRGYSPVLTIADEFSTLQDQDGFYASIFPFITSPFGGEKKLVIVGTPLGRANLFWRLWEEKNDFAKYKLTIWDAKDAGLDVDIDTLKKNFDEEMFRQEFECVPLDSMTSLFSYELLNSVTYETQPNGPILYRVGGMDIGRKHDKTSVAILAVTANGTFIEEIKTFSNMEFQQQYKEASNIIRALKLRKFCVDASGLGMQLGEDLQREFGATVEPVAFTNAIKVEMLNNLKKAFSEGSSKIPDDPELLKEFQSIKRVVNANSISYQADRDADGHADSAIGCALAYRAYLKASADCDFMPISF